MPLPRELEPIGVDVGRVAEEDEAFAAFGQDAVPDRIGLGGRAGAHAEHDPRRRTDLRRGREARLLRRLLRRPRDLDVVARVRREAHEIEDHREVVIRIGRRLVDRDLQPIRRHRLAAPPSMPAIRLGRAEPDPRALRVDVSDHGSERSAVVCSSGRAPDQDRRRKARCEQHPAHDLRPRWEGGDLGVRRSRRWRHGKPIMRPLRQGVDSGGARSRRRLEASPSPRVRVIEARADPDPSTLTNVPVCICRPSIRGYVPT